MNAGSAARPRANWAGNITFGAPDFHRPATLGQLQRIVARASQIRVLATGHSFNDLASQRVYEDLLGCCPWSPSWNGSWPRSARGRTGARSSPPRALRSSYERLPDFLDLIRRYDPAGKFRNAWTDRYLGS